MNPVRLQRTIESYMDIEANPKLQHAYQGTEVKWSLTE